MIWTGSERSRRADEGPAKDRTEGSMVTMRFSGESEVVVVVTGCSTVMVLAVPLTLFFVLGVVALLSICTCFCGVAADLELPVLLGEDCCIVYIVDYYFASIQWSKRTMDRDSGVSRVIPKKDLQTGQILQALFVVPRPPRLPPALAFRDVSFPMVG